MRSLRWIRTLPLGASLSLFGASSAWAQAVQFAQTPPVVQRLDSSGATYGCPDRHSQTNSCIVDGTSQGVGYHDCVDDTALSFSVTMTGVPNPGYSGQLWAGTGDCTVAGATNNNSTAICWPVGQGLQLQVAPQTVKIRVADIVSGLGVPSPPPQTFTAGVDATTSCNGARAASTTTTVTDDAGNATSTAGVSTVTVYFMIFATGAGSQAPVSNVSYPVKVKLVGPNAVSSLTAKTGDTELILDWTPPSGDTTVQGFDLFAVPEGTTFGDGGTTTTCDDASVELLDDAGNAVLDDAGNPVLVPEDAGCTTTSSSSTATCNGTSGSVDVSSISCPTGGDAGSDAGTSGPICQIASGVTTASGTISGLTNGQSYVATVAPFDEYGNAGQVASATCNTPAPIDDFWKVYNQEGGNAYCALEVVGKRGVPFAAALMALVGMIWIRRRRR